MRTYAAGYGRTLLALRLPTALPFIFTALKVNATLALIGAIVAEFFGTPIVGMGFRISIEAARLSSRHGLGRDRARRAGGLRLLRSRRSDRARHDRLASGDAGSLTGYRGAAEGRLGLTREETGMAGIEGHMRALVCAGARRCSDSLWAGRRRPRR